MEKWCIFPEKEIEKITWEHNIVTTSLARFCGSTGEEILAILTIRNQPRSEYSPLHYWYNTYSKKIWSKIRVLREPEERLQKIQNQIRKQLLLIPVSFASTAWKPGDSAIKNAEIHKHNPYLISLDIKDAYPSINTRRVYENLKWSLNKPLSIRCPQITNQDDKQKCIRAITHLCMSENELPQWAPTSNQILNIVLTKLDIVLETELPNMVWPHVKYSRYADDITISFPHFSTKDVLQETFETYQKEYQEDRQWMIQSFEKNTFILTDKHDLHYLQEQIKKIEEQIHDDWWLDNETKYAYISTIHQYKQQIHYTDWNIQTVVTKIIELIQKQW